MVVALMLHKRLWLLLGLLVLCCLAYLLIGVNGSWSFALQFRGEKLLSLILVASSQAVAAIMFQTITGNRILTPAVMGFDALYILFVTSLVFVFGAQAILTLDPRLMMLASAGLLCTAAVALFGLVLRRGQGDLMRMLLTGVVLAVMFRSITSFLQRAIDPNEYAAVQASSFARFTSVERELLVLAFVLSISAMVLAWRMRFRLDVLSLGYETAVSLGENPLKGQRQALMIIALLVSVSTALVGPVGFFGILVTALTYLLFPTPRHEVLLPAAVLIASVVLVGGQALMERVFSFGTPLSVVVEFIGGLVFLTLLLRGIRS